MEIITAIELQALNLDCGIKDTSTENLQQTFSRILSKTIGKKQQDNLSLIETVAVKQIKDNKQMKVYPFPKGMRLALLNDMDGISKIKEQLGKLKIIDMKPQTT